MMGITNCLASITGIIAPIVVSAIVYTPVIPHNPIEFLMFKHDFFFQLECGGDDRDRWVNGKRFSSCRPAFTPPRASFTSFSAPGSNRNGIESNQTRPTIRINRLSTRQDMKRKIKSLPNLEETLNVLIHEIFRHFVFSVCSWPQTRKQRQLCPIPSEKLIQSIK